MEFDTELFTEAALSLIVYKVKIMNHQDPEINYIKCTC